MNFTKLISIDNLIEFRNQRVEKMRTYLDESEVKYRGGRQGSWSCASTRHDWSKRLCHLCIKDYSNMLLILISLIKIQLGISHSDVLKNACRQWRKLILRAIAPAPVGG